MSGNPAVLISDDLVSLLEDRSLCKAAFQELAGTLYPWEVDFRVFQIIRGKLYRIEKGLRSANPDHEITCVASGKGMYWLQREGLEDFLDGLKRPVQKLRLEGPIPVWKMTSAEIFGSHLSNLRQLILAAAHDVVFLDFLRESLGSNHDFISREFENSELSVRGQLDSIQDQGPNLAFATTKEVMLVERCRVTQEMLERRVATEQELGYTMADLRRVTEVLDRQCRTEMPAYRKRIQAVSNRVKEFLREGECSQLTRSSRWEMTYGLIGSLPFGFRGQAQTTALERDGMKATVTSREKEMGHSETGARALEMSKQVDEVFGKKMESVREEPVVQPAAERAMPEPAKKKDVVRMAYTTRSKR